MKKQTVSALLSTCMVLSTAPTAFAAQDFAETKEEKPYGISATSVLAAQSMEEIVDDANIEMTVTLPEDLIAGQTYENASATLKTTQNWDASSKNVRLRVIVNEKPSDTDPTIIATDDFGDWDLVKDGWGPPEGFILPAEYTATTPFKIQFPDSGTYKVTLQLIEVNGGTEGKILESVETTRTVKELPTEENTQEVDTKEKLKSALSSATDGDVIKVTGNGFDLTEEITVKKGVTLNIGEYLIQSGTVKAEVGATIQVESDGVPHTMIGANGLDVTQGTVTVEFGTDVGTKTTIPAGSVAEIKGTFMDTGDNNDAYRVPKSDTMIVEGELNLRTVKMEVLGSLNVAGTVNVNQQTLALVQNKSGTIGGTMTVNAPGRVILSNEAILDIATKAKAEGTGTLNLDGGKVTGDGENQIENIIGGGSDVEVDVPSKVEGGTASSSVSDTDLIDAISNLPEGGGAINIDATANSGSTDDINKSKVTLKNNALSSLINESNKVTEVAIKTDMGTIAIDNATLKNIAESVGTSGDVTLNMEKQQNVSGIEAESKEVYDITFIGSNNAEILVNNANIKMTLQFSGLTDIANKSIGWKDNSGSGEIDGATFVPVSNTSNTYQATFTTKHLTQFYVVNKTSTQDKLNLKFTNGGLGEKGTITGTGKGTYFTIQVTDSTSGANAIYTVEIPDDKTADISVPDYSTVQVWETNGEPNYKDGMIDTSNVTGYGRKDAISTAKK